MQDSGKRPSRNLHDEARWLAASAAASFLALIAYLAVSALVEGNAFAFDRDLLAWVRAQTGGQDPAAEALRSLMIGMTVIGKGVWLGCFAAASFLYLWLLGKRKLAISLGLGTASVMLLSPAIKFVVDRPRPQVVEHLVGVSSQSFPSGHAMKSAFVALIIAAMLSRTRPNPPKTAILAAGVAFTLLVGISRIHLGVHWPSDVLAGWAFGSLWALLVFEAGTRLEARAGPAFR
jgi:undecaprenyl-diphosphatase